MLTKESMMKTEINRSEKVISGWTSAGSQGDPEEGAVVIGVNSTTHADVSKDSLPVGRGGGRSQWHW